MIVPDNVRALRYRNEIKDIVERGGGLVQVAQRMSNEGNMGEAENIIRKALEIDPYHPLGLEWAAKLIPGFTHDPVILEIIFRPMPLSATSSAMIDVKFISFEPLKRARVHVRTSRTGWRHQPLTGKNSVNEDEISVVSTMFTRFFMKPGGLWFWVELEDDGGAVARYGSSDAPVYVEVLE